MSGKVQRGLAIITTATAEIEEQKQALESLSAILFKVGEGFEFEQDEVDPRDYAAIKQIALSFAGRAERIEVSIGRILDGVRTARGEESPEKIS